MSISARLGFDFELMTKPLNPLQLLMRLQAPHHGHAAVDPDPMPADSDGELPDAGSVPAA